MENLRGIIRDLQERLDGLERWSAKSGYVSPLVENARHAEAVAAEDKQHTENLKRAASKDDRMREVARHEAAVETETVRHADAQGQRSADDRAEGGRSFEDDTAISTSAGRARYDERGMRVPDLEPERR